MPGIPFNSLKESSFPLYSSLAQEVLNRDRTYYYFPVFDSSYTVEDCFDYY